MRVTVVGAGNAGCTIAADLAVAGIEVTLYELPRFAANLEPLRERGRIHLRNNRMDKTGRQGEARLARLTTDAREAASSAEIILVATQALGQEEVARVFAPHLRSGHLLLLFTGYGGSLLVRKVLRQAGAPDEIVIAETSTLPYNCRIEGPAQVEMHGKAYKAIPTAAIPATDTQQALKKLEPLYPMLVPAGHVLEVALLNSNVTRHTVGTLLNIGHIEYSKGEFWIYREAFTPAVWRVHDALDAEKMALLRALGRPPLPYLDYKRMVSDLTLEEQAVSGSKGPKSADTRYLAEDVPMGLVFFASLGELLGVPTPTARALIHLACVIGKTDYWAGGRTLEHLGLGGLTAAELRAYVERGTGSGEKPS